MKNIAGQPVRGENFFNRPALIQQFRRKIQSGSSILITAPRRVGKTSLMLHLHDTGMEGYYFIYLISQKENINMDEISNLAQKFNVVEGYREIVNALVYDGYINNNEDHRVYRFNSPLLKMWWWKNVAY